MIARWNQGGMPGMAVPRMYGITNRKFRKQHGSGVCSYSPVLGGYHLESGQVAVVDGRDRRVASMLA